MDGLGRPLASSCARGRFGWGQFLIRCPTCWLLKHFNPPELFAQPSLVGGCRLFGLVSPPLSCRLSRGGLSDISGGLGRSLLLFGRGTWRSRSLASSKPAFVSSCSKVPSARLGGQLQTGTRGLIGPFLRPHDYPVVYLRISLPEQPPQFLGVIVHTLSMLLSPFMELAALDHPNLDRCKSLPPAGLPCYPLLPLGWES